MDGEEAAASLFGSEDSGSDLFATLGAETSPHPAADDLFSGETSTFVQQNDSYGTQGYPSYTMEFPEYTSHPTETQNTDAFEALSQKGTNEQSHWTEGESNVTGSTYPVTYNAQHTEHHASTNNYNGHTPSSYSVGFTGHSSYNAYDPPVASRPSPTTRSSYALYNSIDSTAQVTTHSAHDHTSTMPTTTQPPHGAYIPVPLPTAAELDYESYDSPVATNTQPSYSAYDPPAPVNHTDYRAYEPSVPRVSRAQSNYQPTEPYSSPSVNPNYGTYNPPAPASRAYDPPVAPHSKHDQARSNIIPTAPPPVAKSSVTRPKVSNAYDPPFPTTLPARRGSRPGTVTAQQAYAQYQKPISTYRTQTTEALLSSVDTLYNQPVAPYHESHRSSPNGYASNNVANQAENESYVSDSTISTEYYGHAPSNSVFMESLHIDGGHTGTPVAGAPVHDDYESASPHYVNEKCGTKISEEAPLHLLSHTTNDPHVALESAEPQLASPASIPLPYSPPIEELDASVTVPFAISTSIGKTPLQQSPYISQVQLKKDFTASKDVVEPYTPKITHNANSYIPRTSSPLSTFNGRSNETNKLASSKQSIINSPPYHPISKPLGGISVPPNPYNSIENTSRQTSQWSDAKPVAQELLMKPAVTQYAPSPSLIGANDPLSRTTARAPLVTFGFGGKMITCFHGMPGLNAGFDVAFSSRTTSELKIRTLHKILPESTLASTESSYPGPLLAESGSASISLVRSNLATQTKTKKVSVLSYLAGRISEIHQGLGYLSGPDGRTAENKLILVKLLNVMVENDGRLLGTPQAEAAVRSTLVPRLEGAPAIQDAVSLQSSYKLAASDEKPISVTTLRPSALDKIEELLLLGDRRQAYQFAMEQKLWAHAMVISSSIDKESWKDVVHDFLREELSVMHDSDNSTLGPNGKLSTSPHSAKGNRESLRVAYSLFSGQGPAAIQELAPLSLLQRGLGGHFHPPVMPVTTPRTPNFSAMQPPNVPSIPAESLTKWAETVAMMISSPLTPEASSALTALGDQLLANNWVEAAHVCYLISPQTSLLGGLGSLSARMTLVGAKSPADAMKDSDALIFSEIFEFALSLVPVVKGQEPFHGIPHLQAYRFIKAVQLAEVGHIQSANKYCDSITTSLTHSTPNTNFVLLEQLQGLQQRLSGVFPGEKGGSWIGGKLTKPSLDSFGGWLEGTFTKIVTGQSETAPSAIDPSKSIDQPFAGPFAHYSTISSNTPSARSSPQPQPPFSATFNPPPQRTTSAMATTSPYSLQQAQVERSSSAMGYVRQRPSVQTHPSSNSLSSSQSSPVGASLNNLANGLDPYAPRTQDSLNDESETPVQTSWWRSSSETNGDGVTPTTATFMKVDESTIQASSDGFISLMDNQSFSVGPSKYGSPAPPTIEEDDDDLGLGNSKPKPKAQEAESTAAQNETKAEAPKASAEPAKSEAQVASSTSWLGRWFKRSDSNPAPIKASLGEESAFYYDKEQKRWVNRKVGDDAVAKAAAPPPPPSRAQTASPGMSGAKSHPPMNAPPARSASAVDLSEPPSRAPMRIRSNLAPPMESAPSTPTGTRLTPPSGPPPPARPKSQAAKRNVRSRYVDVFQQEGGAA